MIHQLVLASAMALATVVIHLLGLGMLVKVLRSHRQFWRHVPTAAITLLLLATLGLFAIHTAEIWLYAGLYLWLGAAVDFESALYFSTVTYATVGYGDVLIARSWRVFGAIEGATGVILLGWSTAFLVSILSQLKLFSHDWLSAGRR